jgi:hypothetical protein
MRGGWPAGAREKDCQNPISRSSAKRQRSARLGRLWLGQLFGYLGHGGELRRIRCSVFRDCEDLSDLRRSAQVMEPTDQRRKPGEPTADCGDHESSDGIIELDGEEGAGNCSKKRSRPRQKRGEQPPEDSKEQADPAHRLRCGASRSLRRLLPRQDPGGTPPQRYLMSTGRRGIREELPGWPGESKAPGP